MKFDKNHEIWKKAPWHVKVSVWGVPSLKALYLYAYVAFFAGLLCFVGSVASISFVSAEISEIIYSGTALGLASCMYLFAIIWVKENPECLAS